MSANIYEQLGTLMAQVVAEKMGVGAGFKHDLASTTVTTNLMHGPIGIFGYPGIEQDIFATRVKPRGLMQILPARPSDKTNELVGYLTGFTDDESGTEKDGPCDDPLAAGDMKSCLQGALFGRYERKTKPLEINSIAQRTNRGEFFDLRLVNDPLLEGGLSISPGIPLDAQRSLNNEILGMWMKLGTAFERLLGPQVYTGDPTNNTSGGYAEFHGLETLVGTGKIDVITNDTCPALDSYIHDFNYARIDGASQTFLNVLTTMWRYGEDIASRTGLDPVERVLVMRRNLFYELVDIWPCTYATYRCTTQNVADADIARVLVDGNAQRAMSDEMRRGMYLKIDGEDVRVIIDDFIPEATNTTDAHVPSGCFSSDIYILPLTVRGGILSTYFEYFDFGGVMGQLQSAGMGSLLTNEFFSDGGRFLWTVQRTGWCVEWWAKIEPRLRLLTPHLAARLENVVYCPLRHFREDDPTSAYFYDGGVIVRSNAPYDSNDFPSRA